MTTMVPSSSLVQRSLSSTSWKLGASLVAVGVLFLRAVILARMLEISTFGVYALAFAIVKLSSVIAEFGLGDAFLHRAPETEDENRAAAVHLGLTVLLTSLWATVLVSIAFVATQPPLRTALLVLTATVGVLQLARTPTLVLVRRVMHRRLAMIDLVTAVLTTVIAIWLASRGAELWALLATDIVTAALVFTALYLWRPPWRADLAWIPGVVRYYLGFGSRSFVAGLLSQMVDRVGNLWTGLVLGTTALGFYSRAFTFATYPRRFVARPILGVVAGIYAELKGDTARLSTAFVTVNALLLRFGFGIAGLLAVVSPELVVLVLGDRWMPMVPPFRVLLIFAILAPIERSLAHLLVATGWPGKVTRARVVQLVLVCAGLALFGQRWGVVGVAATVSAALLVPICMLLRWARSHVEFSLMTLVAPPAVALVTAIGAVILIRNLTAQFGDTLVTLVVVGSTFLSVYLFMLLILERHRLRPLIRTCGELVRR
jgi:O-antigen/teichoic acid export membrane protein